MLLQGIFIPLFFIANYLFFSMLYRQWRAIHYAQPEKISSSLSFRIKNLIINVLLQRKLFLHHPIRGFFHVLIFYGFIVYSLHTLSQFIGGFIGSYTFYIPTLLGKRFAHVYDLFLDIFSILVLIGLFFFFTRRYILKAKELERPSFQSLVVIALISLLMIFSLIGEGARAYVYNMEDVPFTRRLLASLFEGASYDLGMFFFHLGWWGHVLTVFVFMIFLPRSKHAHLIWAPINFWYQRPNPKGEIPYLDTENAPVWGASTVVEFSWKDLLDSLSCIECGRCTLECPANRTGKVLDPRNIMLDLKHAFMNTMGEIEKKVKEGKTSLEELNAIDGIRVIDEYTPREAIWACTSCYACVETCPVGNNQLKAILEMRRSLVLNEGAMPQELQNALVNMENQGNPWGVGAHKREEWVEEMKVKTMAQYKEEGKEPEILYWVGCAGVFDERSKKIAKAVISLLKKAKVEFAVLGGEETCTGDSARRAGNEYLYQVLAQQNVETLNQYGVKKIVTACPHCFNTLKNEYPQFGGNYEVYHHTEFLHKLIEEGRLLISREKLEKLGNITYHDSCYLGRYNNLYDAPRKILERSSPHPLYEPVNHKIKGLCCGAGGAQMWMEEDKKTKRMNINRVEELLNTEAKTIATACPFCMVMISDGVKAKGKEEEVNTFDVAEILDQAT